MGYKIEDIHLIFNANFSIFSIIDVEVAETDTNFVSIKDTY